MDQHVETIAKVAEVAGKEFSIEQVKERVVYLLLFILLSMLLLLMS